MSFYFKNLLFNDSKYIDNYLIQLNPLDLNSLILNPLSHFFIRKNPLLASSEELFFDSIIPIKLGNKFSDCGIKKIDNSLQCRSFNFFQYKNLFQYKKPVQKIIHINNIGTYVINKDDHLIKYWPGDLYDRSSLEWNDYTKKLEALGPMSFIESSYKGTTLYGIKLKDKNAACLDWDNNKDCQIPDNLGPIHDMHMLGNTFFCAIRKDDDLLQCWNKDNLQQNTIFHLLGPILTFQVNQNKNTCFIRKDNKDLNCIQLTMTDQQLLSFELFFVPTLGPVVSFKIDEYGQICAVKKNGNVFCWTIDHPHLAPILASETIRGISPSTP